MSGVAYIPSGDYILSCSRDETIKFWDTISGYCLTTLSHGHQEWIRRITVNMSNGNYFASASKDETIVIWNLEAVKKKITEPSRGLDTTASTVNDDCIV